MLRWNHVTTFAMHSRSIAMCATKFKQAEKEACNRSCKKCIFSRYDDSLRLGTEIHIPEARVYSLDRLHDLQVATFAIRFEIKDIPLHYTRVSFATNTTTF